MEKIAALRVVLDQKQVGAPIAHPSENLPHGLGMIELPRILGALPNVVTVLEERGSGLCAVLVLAQSIEAHQISDQIKLISALRGVLSVETIEDAPDSELYARDTAEDAVKKALTVDPNLHPDLTMRVVYARVLHQAMQAMRGVYSR